MNYDGVLQNERQVLLQEQKACRVRAHKFHLETSRRRKALEDRRRQWDVQEQRIRENILQLRKQRMQEATERFQRAHIRPSQRKRPAFVKRTVNIDEALSLIDARGTYTKPSAAILTNTSMGRNSTPPPRSQAFANSARHQREQMSTIGSTKQEDRQRNYRASQPFFLDDLQEAQGLVKDEESIYSWEEDVNPSSPSDSLSSQDSLEIEDLKHRQQLKCGGCCQSSPTASEKDSPQSPQTHNPSRGSRPSSASRHYTTNCHSGSLVPSSPANDYSDLRPSLRDEFVKQMGTLHSLSSATLNHSLKEPSLDTQEQGTLGSHSHCNQLRAEDNLNHMAHHSCTRAVSEAAEIHREVVVNHHHSKTPACPGCRSAELTCWEQECRTVSEQPRGQREDESEYRLTTTQVRQTSSNAFKQQRDTSYKSFVSVVEAITQRASASDNQTSGAVNLHQSNRPQLHTDAVHREEGNQLLSRTMSTCALPVTANVRILKSILKKQSKYEMEQTKFMYSPGHLVITKHMAMSLRDSIELIRGKAKEPENNKTVKKKLRWFDEVNVKNHDVTTVKDSAIPTPAKSRPPVSCNQQGLNQMICAYADAMSTTISTVPSSPQGSSAKQAWADVAVAVEDNKQQEPSQEVPKVQRTFLCTGVPRVPRRVRSARVGTGLTPSCVRKDIILRPQSASEVGNMLRNQRRKMMAPCPPPRPEAGQAERQTAAANSIKAYADDLKLNRPVADRTVQHRHGPDGHAVCPPDEGVVFAPCPPPFATISSETGGQKGRVSFSQHGPHASVKRCGAACEENGICLNRTPTDDEISQLWNGLRSALSTKDDRAYLAQFPDDCMIGDVRSLARMGGNYLSPSHARRPLRRAPQEVNGSKKRMSAQHTAQIPGSANKKLSSPNQSNLKTVPLPRDVQDQGMPGPSQRMGPPQHPPGLSLSGLSLEEQRIQQSLDRLNQRLQYVVGGNPSMKRLFHTEGAHHNVSAKFGEGTNSASRRLSTASSTH